MPKPTQKQLILDYLDQFGSITPMEAMRDLGIMRLAARISDLKEDGYEIRTSMEKMKNRYGKTVYFAKYSIF